MTLPATLTVYGVELRRTDRRHAIGTDHVRVHYHGSRGDLTFWIEALTTKDGALVSAAWEGACVLTYRWTGPQGEHFDRHTLPHAAGDTPESCAATLGEIVRSVAAMLPREVAGG